MPLLAIPSVFCAGSPQPGMDRKRRLASELGRIYLHSGVCWYRGVVVTQSIAGTLWRTTVRLRSRTVGCWTPSCWRKRLGSSLVLFQWTLPELLLQSRAVFGEEYPRLEVCLRAKEYLVRWRKPLTVGTLSRFCRTLKTRRQALRLQKTIVIWDWSL